MTVATYRLYFRAVRWLKNSTSTSRIWAICAALYFFSQIIFLAYIQFPRGHDFDEFHYVPSAKQFLELRQNQNWEHPPLGKELIAVGIKIFGDIPIGWRFMSTVFGSLTLVGMFLWALALLGDVHIALWVAMITMVNHLLYVQARIGMLDTFMMGFLTWAMAAFAAAWNPRVTTSQAKRLFIFCGLMLGLATACKWFALVAWIACAGLVALVRILQGWRTVFLLEEESDWYHVDLWKGIDWKTWALAWVIVPFLAYFATFFPLYLVPNNNLHLMDLLTMQAKMWDGQLRVTNAHPYMSKWWEWAILKRPIWYVFDKEGAHDEWARGVLLLGNPLIMWAGLLAVFGCLISWIKQKSRPAFLIFFAYAVFYFSWGAIPRAVSFYYYYYPAGMVLSLALGYVFQQAERGKLFPVAWARWTFFGAALGLFIHFWPILAAYKIPTENFRIWMWFRSWI